MNGSVCVFYICRFETEALFSTKLGCEGLSKDFLEGLTTLKKVGARYIQVIDILQTEKTLKRLM